MAKGTFRPTAKKIVKEYDPHTKRTRTSLIQIPVERRQLRTFHPPDDEVAAVTAGIVKSSQRDSSANFKAVENRRKQIAAGKARGEIIRTEARKRHAKVISMARELRGQGHRRNLYKLIAQRTGLSPDTVRKILARQASEKSG